MQELMNSHLVKETSTSIVGILSSPRTVKLSSQEEDYVYSSEDIFDSLEVISREKPLSNSQSLLLAALWGAKKEGAHIKLVYPGELVPKSTGIILSTPVYFGGRSSLLQEVITKLYLNNMAVGSISVGAKRNGGQETANIFNLYDSLNKGACIAGNGPPTAQYGGTGWAGNKTAIINDDFGIRTSYGTGRQVARLAKMLLVDDYDSIVPNILVVMDELSKMPKFNSANVSTINIDKLYVKGCRGCPICPNGDANNKYTCIINDDMQEVQQRLDWADCVIILVSKESLKFQRIMERTRFIRRNHFELSEKVFAVIAPTFEIKSVKIMCHMLRHNMFGLPPYYNSNWDVYVDTIEKYAKKSKLFRQNNSQYYNYTPVGYEDANITDQAYRD